MLQDYPLSLIWRFDRIISEMVVRSRLREAWPNYFHGKTSKELKWNSTPISPTSRDRMLRLRPWYTHGRSDKSSVRGWSAFKKTEQC
jgi:hypothetical protein